MPSNERPGGAKREEVRTRCEHDRPVHRALPVGTLDEISTFLRNIKQISFETLELFPGANVLDVGSGTGEDLRRIGSMIGAHGRAIGVDIDRELLAVSRQRSTATTGICTIGHVVGRAEALPLKSAAFDAVRADRVLQHVEQWQIACREMVRVAKPDGVISVLDSDWATLSIALRPAAFERRFVASLAHALPSAHVGRELIGEFADNDLQQINVRAFPVIWRSWADFWHTSLARDSLVRKLIASGRLAATDYQAVVDQLKAADERGSFFAHGNLVMVQGRKRAS
jgi:SAM-dependent methyltransferase